MVLTGVPAKQLPFPEVQEFPQVAMKGQRKTSWIHPPLLCTQQLTRAVGHLKLLTCPASGTDHLGYKMMIWVSLGTPEGRGWHMWAPRVVQGSLCHPQTHPWHGVKSTREGSVAVACKAQQWEQHMEDSWVWVSANAAYLPGRRDVKGNRVDYRPPACHTLFGTGLAQALMCPVTGWHCSYPTPLSAARVLPATKAQHNLPIVPLISGKSLDSDLINNKVLPPWAMGAL